MFLCVVRYEGDPRVQPLREGLRAAGIEDEEIKLLQAITQYAGRDTRDADLFSNKNFFAVAKNSIQRGLKVRRLPPIGGAGLSSVTFGQVLGF